MRLPTIGCHRQNRSECSRSAGYVCGDVLREPGELQCLDRGAGHDGGRIVFEGTPADLVAARSTLTGEHLAAYVGG